MKSFSLAIIVILLLSACTSSRYSMRHDAAPLRSPTQLELQDAAITIEPKSAATHRPYTVRGKKYYPMLSEQGYRESGKASWYGRKFHGHKTSNGEVYDMFKMTAAHKTLPLPSFVKVTNQANGKSVVVRVNDRGPFHDERIIDLSYSAAFKLGFYRHGTADVLIEAITPSDAPAASPYIQVAAASNLANIQLLKDKLETEFNQRGLIKEEGGLYKLHLGPLTDATAAQQLLSKLKASDFQQAFLLYVQSAL